MISIIITSYKEKESIGKAIESFVKQNIKEDYELIAAATDEETGNEIKKYERKYKHVRYFKDKGKGKMSALNELFKVAKGDILILSDGDVFVSEDSVKNILDKFKDEKIGCVTGRPVSLNNKKDKMGYWSHLLCDAGAHLTRKERSERNEYITCSGYLFAFRNMIKEFPRDVPEDAYIPFWFFRKGYKIGYVPEAEVYVKYPNNFKEWMEQKKRIAKAYENYKNITIEGEKSPMMKSFLRELIEGPGKAFSYPKNFREFIWTLELIPARGYMWFLSFYEGKVKKEKHRDKWKRVESSK